MNANPCIHRGASLRMSAEVVFRMADGQSAGRTYAMFACDVLGACLPTLTCTACSKQAVSEVWSRPDGGDPYALQSCKTCHLRVEAKSSDPT